MTNNKIMAMMFFVFFVFFISTDANATFKCTVSGSNTTCTTTRPTFTIHRAGDVITVKFSSSRNVPLNLVVPSTELGLSSILGIWYVDGASLGHQSDDYLYSPTKPLTCSTDDASQAKCDAVFKDYVVGRTITFTRALTYGNTGCISVASRAVQAGGGNGVDTKWPSLNGVTCSYAPPPDCVGDDCDTGEGGGTPEPSLSCSVKTSSIDLAFGSMSMGEAVGKKISKGVTVNCNKAGAKLTMALKKGGSSIGLNNGMTAEITASGKSLGSVITGVKGNNNINVTAELAGTEVEGEFSGSGVLVTDFQ